MEAAVPPVVIPMWLTGFETLMPEGRVFPYKYLPRPGAQLSVTFGEPIPDADIRKALDMIGHDVQLSGWGSVTSEPQDYPSRQSDQILRQLNQHQHQPRAPTLQPSSDTMKVREEITRIIHDAVESLGRSVSGDSLAERTQQE
jgi:monolysocardiolipin acyltransferase